MIIPILIVNYEDRGTLRFTKLKWIKKPEQKTATREDYEYIEEESELLSDTADALLDEGQDT